MNLNDDDDNNLSKTQMIPIGNNINLDNFNNTIKLNNNKNNQIYNNINTTSTQLQTPKGANINPNQNIYKINDSAPTGDNNDLILTLNLNNLEYSFDCTNAMYLTSYIYHGTDEVKQEIIVKNNGNKQWPVNTKFKILEKSDIYANDIILSPQKPEEQKSYYLIFKNLSNYQVGEYQANIAFFVDDKIYGDKLVIRIKIREIDNQDEEIKGYLDTINEFRDTFNLSEDEYPNDKILDILKENDFNFEAAFSSLFG